MKKEHQEAIQVLEEQIKEITPLWEELKKKKILEEAFNEASCVLRSLRRSIDFLTKDSNKNKREIK